MIDYLSIHWLDILTTVLGLVYLLLEYRASIALWLVGIIMPAMDVYLYWTHGLYGDAGMAVYYTVAAIYGYAVWKFGHKSGQKESEEMRRPHHLSRLPSRVYRRHRQGGTGWHIRRRACGGSLHKHHKDRHRATWCGSRHRLHRDMELLQRWRQAMWQVWHMRGAQRGATRCGN